MPIRDAMEGRHLAEAVERSGAVQREGAESAEGMNLDGAGLILIQRNGIRLAVRGQHD